MGPRTIHGRKSFQEELEVQLSQLVAQAAQQVLQDSKGQAAQAQAQQAAQNYATGASGALGNFGNAQASNIIGQGNARASGYIGGANALSSGVGQGINFYQNQQYLNNLNLARNPNAYGSGMMNTQPVGVTSGNPVYYDF